MFFIGFQDVFGRNPLSPLLSQVFVDARYDMRVTSSLFSDNHIGVTGTFRSTTSFWLHGGDLLRFDMEDVTIRGATAASTCEASVECGSLNNFGDVLGETCGSTVPHYRRVGFMLPIIYSSSKVSGTIAFSLFNI